MEIYPPGSLMVGAHCLVGLVVAGRAVARRLALRSRGLGLLKALTKGSDDPARLALAEEAARIADRLDELDRMIRGKGLVDLVRVKDVLVTDYDDRREVVVIVQGFGNVVSEARQQAATLTAIVAKLGATGAAARPAGKPAEPPAPAGPATPMTPIEKARQAREKRAAAGLAGA